MTKYILVTGGVVSGLGKGVTAASLGRLLKARGLKVTAQKEHPFFIGVQYHPEFKPRPNRPHPLFREFVRAVLEISERHNWSYYQHE